MKFVLVEFVISKFVLVEFSLCTTQLVRISHFTVFPRSQNSCYAGTPCKCKRHLGGSLEFFHVLHPRLFMPESPLLTRLPLFFLLSEMVEFQDRIFYYGSLCERALKVKKCVGTHHLHIFLMTNDEFLWYNRYHCTKKRCETQQKFSLF